jgi:hypothetical protein
MNCSIVEIGPLKAAFIPLDVFPLIDSGSLIYVDLLKEFLVWEPFPDGFWVKYGIVVERSPSSSDALTIKGIYSPTSKNDATSVDVGYK